MVSVLPLSGFQPGLIAYFFVPIHLIDKIAFAAGFLGGSQAPAFVADYTQRLAGQLEQAKLDLRLFQSIADKFHGGSLEALIRKHLDSDDPTFRAEGAVIRELSEQVSRLSDATASLQGGVLQQLNHMISDPDMAMVGATWQGFDPGIVMQPGTLVSAFLLAVVFASVTHFVPGLVRLLFKRRSSALAPVDSKRGPVG